MPYKVMPCHVRLSSAAGAALCACAPLAAIDNKPSKKPILSMPRPRSLRLPAQNSEVNFESFTARPPTVVVVGFNRRIVTVILRALVGARSPVIIVYISHTCEMVTTDCVSLATNLWQRIAPWLRLGGPWGTQPGVLRRHRRWPPRPSEARINPCSSLYVSACSARFQTRRRIRNAIEGLLPLPIRAALQPGDRGGRPCCLQRCMKRTNQGLFASPAWQTGIHSPQPSEIAVGYLEAEAIYLLAARCDAGRRDDVQMPRDMKVVEPAVIVRLIASNPVPAAYFVDVHVVGSTAWGRRQNRSVRDRKSLRLRDGVNNRRAIGTRIQSRMLR